MKPIAPQGEWLKSRILSGHREIAIVFMGRHASQRALSFHTDLPLERITLYLPSGTSPHVFTWPVQNCEIYLCDTSISSFSFVQKVVKTLFISGATLIHYLNPLSPMIKNQTFSRS